MVSARVYKILGFALIILVISGIFIYWRDLIGAENLLAWSAIFFVFLLSIIYLITGYRGRENKYTNFSIYLLFLLIPIGLFLIGIFIIPGLFFVVSGILGSNAFIIILMGIIILSIILSIIGLFQKSSE